MSTIALQDPDRRDGRAPLPRVIGWSVGVAAVAGLLAWSYSSPIARMVTTWWSDPDYSHGFLVIPVAALILFKRPRPDPGRWPIAPAAWGWAILAVSLAARAWTAERGYGWLEVMTLIPAIVGLVAAAGGVGLLGWTWPSIAYLLFMIPMPSRLVGTISQPLQSAATVGSCALLRTFGLWVMHEGNIIVVGSEQLEVAAACSGLSMLVCLAATIIATLMLMPTTNGRRLALILSIIPIALGCNVIRIAATTWCYDRYGAKIGGPWAHDVAGWLMMPLAILLVGLELVALSAVLGPPRPAPSRPVGGSRPR